MAPSAGHFHQLVGKNVKLIRFAWQKASRLVQSNLAQASRPIEPVLQHAPARNGGSRFPIHPRAFLQQGKSRWFTTRSGDVGARHFTNSAGIRNSGARYSRAALPKSRVGDAVRAFTGRAPFASTLRPNLTGGTLGRSAGGYSIGGGRVGGARYFSHTPAAPAEVVQNVSQALRAFFLEGNRLHFDGVDSRTGEKRWKAVSVLQHDVARKTSGLPKATPGSYVDFHINPTVTAFSQLGSVPGFSGTAQQAATLTTEGLTDMLAADFSRAVKDMAIVLKDVERLSNLGDLTITYQSSALRVHFPGCDAETVEKLCDELGVRRGVIYQDEDFDSYVGTEIALLFPFAPSQTVSEMSLYEQPVQGKQKRQEDIDWRNMLSPTHHSSTSEHFSTRSETGMDYEEINANPWASSPSGYESLRSSDMDPAFADYERPESHSPLEYQGFEGIYRFLEQCEPARG